MSTKHLTATLATALALSAVSVTAAQARPTGVDLTNGTRKVASGPSVPIIHGHLGSGHIASGGTLISTAPKLTATKQSAAPSGGESSLTLVAELVGLLLLGVALIAVWFAARTGRGIRPLPH